MDQNNLLGMMALGDAFGSLRSIGGGDPGPQRALPFAMKQAEDDKRRQQAMQALSVLGVGGQGGQGGQQGGLGLPQNVMQALSATAAYDPELALQSGLQYATRVPETTEWERLTQGMSPEDMETARRVRLGLAPDADTALRVGAQSAPQPATFRMATPEEAQTYGSPGQIDTATGRFYPLKEGQGMTVYGPDGQPIMTTGDPGKVKPFTEAQSKDVVYATRARGALEAFEPHAGAMTSIRDRALNADPTGVARGAFQRDDFQVAQNAGNEFLQAILRKDTGAAITRDEQELYGKTYLPQPGDNAAALEEKRRARQRAITAIEAGMSPAQMIAQERGMRQGKQPVSAPRPYEKLSDDELLRLLGRQ